MNPLQKIQTITTKIEAGASLSKEETKAFEKLKGDYGLNENGTVKTIKALAEILGVSRPTIYKMKSEGMRIEPDGTYDPERIMEWRGAKTAAQVKADQTGGNGDVSEKVQWETEFRKWRAKLGEVAYRKEIGELIPKADVEALLVDRATEFKKALLGRGRRLSLRLAHKDAQQCQSLLDADSLQILETYSRENKLIAKTPKKRSKSKRAKKNER